MGFTPKMGVPAQAMNYLFNEHAKALIEHKDILDAVVGWTGQGAALNFINASSRDPFGLPATAAFWEPFSSSWWVLGEDGYNTATSDMGASWRTPWTSLSGTPPDYLGGASDTHGVVVLCTNTRSVTVVQDLAETNPLTGEGYDCFGVSSVMESAIVYLYPNFVCVARPVAGSTILVRTSSSGNTWTTRTAPVGWAAIRPQLVTLSSGRIVLSGLKSDGTAFLTSYSDDGGVTWSAAATKTVTLLAGVTGYSDLFVSYDAASNRLLAVVRLASSGQPTKTVLYASTDNGVTWTAVGTGLNQVALDRPACVGGMWVATAKKFLGPYTSAFIAYSLDDGATWYHAGLGLQNEGTSGGMSLGVGCWSAAGGLLALSSKRAYVGMRQGEPAVGLLT